MTIWHPCLAVMKLIEWGSDDAASTDMSPTMEFHQLGCLTAFAAALLVMKQLLLGCYWSWHSTHLAKPLTVSSFRGQTRGSLFFPIILERTCWIAALVLALVLLMGQQVHNGSNSQSTSWIVLSLGLAFVMSSQSPKKGTKKGLQQMHLGEFALWSLSNSCSNEFRMILHCSIAINITWRSPWWEATHLVATETLKENGSSLFCWINQDGWHVQLWRLLSKPFGNCISDTLNSMGCSKESFMQLLAACMSQGSVTPTLMHKAWI